MSGRRVAPPSTRTARVRTRSRGARRAETPVLAAWGVTAPGHRQTVSLVTLSAVLLVSTALVPGGTAQPDPAADHRSTSQAEAQAATPGTPGVVLSRPADRSGGARTAGATVPAQKADVAAQDPANEAAVAGPTGDSGDQAHLISQSSGGNAAGTSAETGPGAGSPDPGPTTPASETGGNGTAPGDGGAESPAPGAPAQPGPSAPAIPSTPPPVAPPATQAPAPKPPAPQPGTPAPNPPQGTRCIVDVLGIKICLPVLGG